MRAANTIPDLILADLRLRDGQKGVDAIAQLRKRFGMAIPTILVTGQTAAEQRKLAKASGYDIWQKPARPVRLRLAIH